MARQQWRAINHLKRVFDQGRERPQSRWQLTKMKRKLTRKINLSLLRLFHYSAIPQPIKLHLCYFLRILRPPLTNLLSHRHQTRLKVQLIDPCLL